VYTQHHDLPEVDRQLRAAFQSRLRIVPEIKFLTVAELEMMQMGKQERKVRRFLDNRHNTRT
jgi:hypothetical protein